MMALSSWTLCSLYLVADPISQTHAFTTTQSTTVRSSITIDGNGMKNSMDHDRWYRSSNQRRTWLNSQKSSTSPNTKTSHDDNEFNSAANGINGSSSKDDEEAPTAPEVNTWTTIMTDPDPFASPLDTPTNSIYTALSALTPSDYTQIETYWDHIIPHVSYLGKREEEKVKEALKVAYCAHKGQARKSGEPFIIHPVEVSILLAGLKMDAETVMAGLLHDTVEDTELTFSQIEDMFGSVVKSIVEGETKVSKLPRLAFSDYADEQAENLRQMFVAMTDDYRIIIVKLADRLHNMRTLSFMKPEKQLKISRETLDIFAPLAHRMGIWQFKSELEDISFMYLYPREYKRLNRRLRRHQTKFRETLDRSQKILEHTLQNDRTLKEQAVEVKVSGRTKELYSLWHKMDTKGESDLGHISDVVALRVIVEPKQPEDAVDNDTDVGVWLCYHVLGLVQHLPGFQPVPTKVKDYISFPKPNGYQSLHTALMLNGQTIEVQIRTSTMHQIAEYGMASHWAYKDGKKRPVNNQADSLYNTPWLSSIKEWQAEALCSRDFVDCVRRELLGKRVFVFLRNGKILNLAKGATVIDAAFQIHTEVGLTMHGVEINGKPVSFSYELRNGDVVSVLTGDGKPATDWMRFAKIRSTRSKLRSYFRKKQRESLRDAGSIILMDFLDVYGKLIKESSFLDDDFTVPKTIEDLIKFLPGNSQYSDLEELLLDIGTTHDRELLRTAVAKIFLVPQKMLMSAEEDRRENFMSSYILHAVKAKRKSASDVEEALAGEGEDFGLDDNAGRISDDMFGMRNDQPSMTMGSQLMNNRKVTGSKTVDDTNFESADPEYLCEICLPILGDDVVGTRPVGRSDEFVTTVHRCGCYIAQRAINQSKVTNSDVDGHQSFRSRVNSRIGGLDRYRSQKETENEVLEAVKLKWDDHYLASENILFFAEISVIAKDRKLLLADISELVSDMSEIVKTGSMSSDEHANFRFLVKIQNIDALQNLMDAVMEVPSVMSVERKFGSSL
jgi:GTP pyrophosphokinase